MNTAFFLAGKAASFLLRRATQLVLGYLPKVLVKMRVRGESNRSLGRILRKSCEAYQALRSSGVGRFAWKNLIKLPHF